MSLIDFRAQVVALGPAVRPTGGGIVQPVSSPLGRFGSLLPRLGDAVVNGLEILAMGGLEVDDEPAPFDVVSEDRLHRLRHYFADSATGAPVAVLVPPLMLSADVYDVSERSSAVSILHELGVDPWVVDFGAPEREEGGMQRTLSDHVLAVDRAVTQVGHLTGRPVHLCGYSQGGMFCYQAAAYRRGDGLTSLVTFGSPVDTLALDPIGLPDEVVTRVAGIGADLLRGVGIPAWATRMGFRLLDPVKSVRQRVEFVAQLHDRDRLAARERQRRFLAGEGWVAYSGPALADLLQQFVVHNRMTSGGFEIGDRLVTLADIALPVMSVVGETDQIAPARVVRAVARAAPAAEVWEMTVPAGHFGLVVGSYAAANTWPTVAGWIHWREGGGSPPAAISPLIDVPSSDRSVRSGAGYRLGLAAEVGIGATKAMAGSVVRSAHAARSISAEAVTQLPRLARVEQIRAATQVSFGSLLDEQAVADTNATCFLFGDRTHSRGDTKHRIDSVVRGLMSVGVRQGEPIGVLMSTRPSAFVVTAALNRLGAVAVLLRPGGDCAHEAVLGGVCRLLTDPDHAAEGLAACDVPVIVLGAAGRSEELPDGAIDLELVDPATVEVPRWYRPNPGRAGDLAFVVFSGEGAGTRARRITNHRWALSAFGTASAAALSPKDTVYATTPLHHPSGLLTAIGGAVAGGARLALSREFSPAVFWEEVRRYGATVVSYTWTMLREVAEQEPDRRELHHGIRLFIGSGMPRGLWSRVDRRLGPARVVEFYAPIEGEAVLANVAANKPAAMGRPLPGSAPLRIAAYDLGAGCFELDEHGLVRECAPGEIGMLLVGRHPAESVSAAPLRGVFKSGDAWRPSGDLFWRDTDGDHWLAGPAAAVLPPSPGGIPLLPALIDDALGVLPGVDLAVTYRVAGSAGPLTVSAVTLMVGSEPFTGAELTDALGSLQRTGGPDVVRVVGRIPLTDWYRPYPGSLTDDGLGDGSDGTRPAWYRDSEGRYVPLTCAAREQLVGVAGTSRRTVE